MGSNGQPFVSAAVLCLSLMATGSGSFWANLSVCRNLERWEKKAFLHWAPGASPPPERVAAGKYFHLVVLFFFSEYVDCDGKETQQQRRNSRLWDYCSQKEPRLQPGDGDDICAQWHDPKIPTRWAWCWHGVNIFIFFYFWQSDYSSQS